MDRNPTGGGSLLHKNSSYGIWSLWNAKQLRSYVWNLLHGVFIAFPQAGIDLEIRRCYFWFESKSESVIWALASWEDPESRNPSSSSPRALLVQLVASESWARLNKAMSFVGFCCCGLTFLKERSSGWLLDKSQELRREFEQFPRSISAEVRPSSIFQISHELFQLFPENLRKFGRESSNFRNLYLQNADCPLDPHVWKIFQESFRLFLENPRKFRIKSSIF